MLTFNKILLTALCVSAFMPGLSAQQTQQSTVCITDSINAAGNIRIEQPASVAAMVTSTIVAPPSESGSAAPVSNQAAATRSGYRVQVFDDNNPRTARQQAAARQAQMHAAFPQWRAYVNFNSPYWQVRVGDFHSRAQAEEAMRTIREAFPASAPYIRIVRDKIHYND